MLPAPARARPATEVRADHVRTSLGLLGEADPALLEQVRRRLGPPALALLDGAPRMAWIPGLVDVALWRAVHEAQGDGGVRRLARSLGVRHVRTGRLSSLLQGVVQLFGLSPSGIVRWFPHGFGDVHRGVGELRVEEVTERSARLALVDLHPCLAGEPWLLAVAGSLELALEVSGLDGEGTLEHPGPGRAVFGLAWRPRAAGAPGG